jgi:hypothetical protein
MKRIYHPYWKWEDYQAGLYNNIEDAFTEEETEFLAGLAKELLSDPEVFRFIALKVISKWKNAAEENLTNDSRNKQAWIGQASCCYAIYVPEFITKFGWHLMTPTQQEEANQVADAVIEEWNMRQGGRVYAKKLSDF